MVRRKFNYYNPSRFKYSRFKNLRGSLQDIPLKTIRVTFHALRWVFMLIFLFIVIGILVLLLTGGQSYLQVIVGYSITGFFTFFMGYFGWILAQSMIDIMVGKESKKSHGFSYYFKRSNKFKF